MGNTYSPRERLPVFRYILNRFRQYFECAPSAPERQQTMASPPGDFARNNQPRFLDELKTLLRIPSISTLDEHKSDVLKAAEFVADELRRIGMDNVEIIPTQGHTLLYADGVDAEGGAGGR